MTGLGYTLPAVLAVIAVCVLEFGVLRTGLFRRPAYWISMVIVFAFPDPRRRLAHQAVSAPIVIYDDRHTSGIRFPFDIPVEDFLFGWALVTAVLLLWERQRLRDRAKESAVRRSRRPAEVEVPARVRRGRGCLRRAGRRQSRLSRHLRMSAQRMRLPTGGKGLRLLDAGCGTGASTAALLCRRAAGRDRRRGRVVGHVGRRPPRSAGRDRCGSCTAASRTSPTQASTARSTASWPPTCCATSPTRTHNCSAFRALLRPGATLAVHEYSVRDSRLATAMWNAVCAAIIIPIGRLRSGDAALYRYLRRSVNEFDGRSAFRDRLRANGFTDVRSETMPGWQRNIVHTFLAEAPR